MMKKEKTRTPTNWRTKSRHTSGKVNKTTFKANNGCLRAAKQIMMGSKQATPGEETTKMIQAKLPRDELPEEEWKKMNDEIEECKRLAWKIKPLSRRRVLARLDGAEPGRSRTRNSHLKALQYVPEGLTSFVNWARM